LIDDEKFAHEYLGFADGTYAMWKFRVLLTNLLAEAWERLCQTKDFTALGLRTGCLMPKVGYDRSSLQSIVIDGCMNYDFAKAPVSGNPGNGSPDESLPSQEPTSDSNAPVNEQFSVVAASFESSSSDNRAGSKRRRKAKSSSDDDDSRSDTSSSESSAASYQSASDGEMDDQCSDQSSLLGFDDEIADNITLNMMKVQ
jgi:hypothetical protein